MVTTVASADRDKGLGLPTGLFLRHIGGQESPVVTNVAERAKDRSSSWLRIAMAALAVLAATSAIVSYQAQFQMVLAFKHVRTVAELQAAIPDVSALVFAALGIALALHGKRAVRARLLNVAAVGTSIAMNALAASSGWKAMAVWTLAPIAYAVTSDTLIGVLRAYTLAKQRELNEHLDDDDATPLAVLGKVFLYGLRFMVSPISTIKGARRALLQATPVPASELKLRALPWPPAQAEPTTNAVAAPIAPKAIEAPKPSKPAQRKTAKPKATGKPGGKQAELIRLAIDNGLVDKPLNEVSKLATTLAAKVDLHPATARRVLLAHARSLQGGEQQ